MTRQQNNPKGVEPTIEKKQTEEVMKFELNQIGVIMTPYTDNAPYQPWRRTREVLERKNQKINKNLITNHCTRPKS